MHQIQISSIATKEIFDQITTLLKTPVRHPKQELNRIIERFLFYGNKNKDMPGIRAEFSELSKGTKGVYALFNKSNKTFKTKQDTFRFAIEFALLQLHLAKTILSNKELRYESLKNMHNYIGQAITTLILPKKVISERSPLFFAFMKLTQAILNDLLLTNKDAAVLHDKLDLRIFMYIKNKTNPDSALPIERLPLFFYNNFIMFQSKPRITDNISLNNEQTESLSFEEYTKKLQRDYTSDYLKNYKRLEKKYDSYAYQIYLFSICLLGLVGISITITNLQANKILHACLYLTLPIFSVAALKKSPSNFIQGAKDKLDAYDNGLNSIFEHFELEASSSNQDTESNTTPTAKTHLKKRTSPSKKNNYAKPNNDAITITIKTSFAVHRKKPQKIESTKNSNQHLFNNKQKKNKKNSSRPTSTFHIGTHNNCPILLAPCDKILNGDNSKTFKKSYNKLTETSSLDINKANKRDKKLDDIFKVKTGASDSQDNRFYSHTIKNNGTTFYVICAYLEKHGDTDLNKPSFRKNMKQLAQQIVDQHLEELSSAPAPA